MFWSLPLFYWCVSGSRFPSLFFVDGGAAISVASMVVPLRMIKRIFCQASVDRLEDLAVGPLASSRRRNVNKAVASSADRGLDRCRQSADGLVDCIFDAFIRKPKHC